MISGTMTRRPAAQSTTAHCWQANTGGVGRGLHRSPSGPELRTTAALTPPFPFPQAGTASAHPRRAAGFRSRLRALGPSISDSLASHMTPSAILRRRPIRAEPSRSIRTTRTTANPRPSKPQAPSTLEPPHSRTTTSVILAPSSTAAMPKPATAMTRTIAKPASLWALRTRAC